MTAQLMIRPSSLMYSGLKVRQFGNIHIFRFAEELQSRMEELLEIKKAKSLRQKKKLNMPEYVN